MIDLTIQGTLSRDGISQGACIWCGRDATSRAFAPGIGMEVPVHILCCAVIVRQARIYVERGIASPEWTAYAGRLEAYRDGRLLEAGDADRT